MPFVEEKHLVSFHRHIEEKEISEERLAREVQEQRRINERYRLRNKRMAWSLALVGVLAVAVTALYLIRLSAAEEAQLQAQQKVVLEQAQWQEFRETLELRSAEVDSLKRTLKTLDYRALDEEVVYTVQVAALMDERVPLVSEELMNLNVYKDLPYTKYTMGRFTDVKDARQLRKALMDLGFKNAFVVSYKKDKRLKIIDPLAYE